MKIRSLFLSLPLIASFVLVSELSQAGKRCGQGHDNQLVDYFASMPDDTLWAILQHSSLKDLPSQNLVNKQWWSVATDLLLRQSPFGAKVTDGKTNRWVFIQEYLDNEENGWEVKQLSDPLALLKWFRDKEDVSQKHVTAILSLRKVLRGAMLQTLSDNWKENLEDLIWKKQKEGAGIWHEGKAYGTAFFANHVMELEAPHDWAEKASRKAAKRVVWDLAWERARNTFEAAMGLAWDAPWKDAEYTAMDVATKSDLVAAWDAASKVLGDDRLNMEEARDSIWLSVYVRVSRPFQESVESKLKALAPQSASETGAMSYALAEVFTLLWLTENAHEYMKKAFDTAYEAFPEVEIGEVKAVIEAAINKPELKGNVFIEALWRDLDALEKFVVAK